MQRFNNYKKALSQLQKFIDKKDHLSDLEEQGLIKSFEYTYELGWNTMKDFYEDQGEVNLQGSRDTIRLAFKRGIINNGDGWMEMLQHRNETAHTYEEKTADKIVAAIINHHHALFIEFRNAMEKEVARQ